MRKQRSPCLIGYSNTNYLRTARWCIHRIKVHGVSGIPGNSSRIYIHAYLSQSCFKDSTQKREREKNPKGSKKAFNELGGTSSPVWWRVPGKRRKRERKKRTKSCESESNWRQSHRSDRRSSLWGYRGNPKIRRRKGTTMSLLQFSSLSYFFLSFKWKKKENCNSLLFRFLFVVRRAHSHKRWLERRNVSFHPEKKKKKKIRFAYLNAARSTPSFFSSGVARRRRKKKKTGVCAYRHHSQRTWRFNSNAGACDGRIGCQEFPLLYWRRFHPRTQAHPLRSLESIKKMFRKKRDRES